MSGQEGRYNSYEQQSGANTPYNYQPYNNSSGYPAGSYQHDGSRTTPRPVGDQPRSPTQRPPFSTQPFQVYQSYSVPGHQSAWTQGSQPHSSPNEPSQASPQLYQQHSPPSHSGQSSQQHIQPQTAHWPSVYPNAYAAPPQQPSPPTSAPPIDSGAESSVPPSRADTSQLGRPLFSATSTGVKPPQGPEVSAATPSQARDKQSDSVGQSKSTPPHGLVGLDYAKLMASMESMIDSAPSLHDSTQGGSVQPQILENMLGSASFAAQMLESAVTQSPSTLPRPGDDDSGGPEHKRQKTEGNLPEGQVCLGCEATSTPEWRRGPLGPRTLCNACGLVYAKMIKKRSREGKRKRETGESKSGGTGHTGGGEESEVSISDDDASSTSVEHPTM